MNKSMDSRALFETSDLNSLRPTLLHSLNTLNNIQPADGGHSIIIWNEKTETYDVGATTVPKQPNGVTERRVRRTGGATRWIIDEKQPLIVSNIRDDPFKANQLLDDYGLQAYVGVPLMIEEKAIGVLYAMSRKTRNYSTSEVALMQDFARFIAITIHNMLLKLEVDQVHKEVVQERNLLQLIIDATPVNIYFKDLESNFKKINKSSLQHYSLASVDEIIGKSDFDFYPEKIAKRFREDDQYVIQTQQALYNREELNILRDGNERFVLTTKIPLYDADESIIGLVGVTRDITERKLAEQKFRQLEYERRRVEILQKFINDASHDFKTPLSNLKTQLFLLKHGIKDHPASQRLDIMTTQVDRLTNLVESMLHMTRIDALDSLTLERVDPNSLLQHVIGELSSQLDLNQVNIFFQVNDQVDHVLANTIELTFAFNELISNAIRNTPANGQINVTIDKTLDAITVVFSDSGIGIPPEDIPKIFERFYRGDEARSLATGGSGLGLAIVKRIIELHDGSIQVQSIVGEGSKFTVTLPNR